MTKGRQEWAVIRTKLEMFAPARQMIFPVSENWPTNCNFSLFSKLPANYTKTLEKLQQAYANLPRSGTFWCETCMCLIFFVSLVSTFENNENYNSRLVSQEKITMENLTDTTATILSHTFTIVHVAFHAQFKSTHTSFRMWRYQRRRHRENLADLRKTGQDRTRQDMTVRNKQKRTQRLWKPWGGIATL